MNFCIDRATFNISKKVLRIITEPIHLYGIKEIKVRNYKKCMGCKFYNSDNANAQKYCENYCSEKYITRNIVKFNVKPNLKASKRKLSVKAKTSNNNGLAFKFNPTFRFSLTQIKQAVMLYSLCDSKGIIRELNKKKLAKALNCTVKTIENNNKVFIKHGLFDIKRDYAGHCHVIIKNYEKQYAKDGEGYCVIPAKVSKKMMTLSSVNDVRFLVQAILKNDINFKLNRDTTFSIKEIKGIFPSQMHTASNIKSTLSRITEVCKEFVYGVINDSNHVIFNFTEKAHGVFVRNNTFNKNKETLENYIKEHKMVKYLDVRNSTDCKAVIDKSTRDLAELSLDYGINLVLMALGEIDRKVDNIGGYCREIIKKYCNLHRVSLDLI